MTRGWLGEGGTGMYCSKHTKLKFCRMNTSRDLLYSMEPIVNYIITVYIQLYTVIYIVYIYTVHIYSIYTVIIAI